MESIYNRDMVKPMWLELKKVGVEPLTTPEEVDRVLAEKTGTTLVVVNSVCGCAAGTARPGVALALQNTKIPDRLYTVFAGVDRAAVERARFHMGDVPPSSPSVALFKDGELAFMMPRQFIEGRSEQEVAGMLAEAFDKYCTGEGPSVSREQMFAAFGAVDPEKCGSDYKN
jgi:putative YphP/YqiW family bacilliredoxin